MEDYTYRFEKKLPKIVLLQAARECDQLDMMYRFIALHTPTGGIVEILPGEEIITSNGSVKMKVHEKTYDGSTYYYTALLHNSHKQISKEDGIKAIKYVTQWFINNPEEPKACESTIYFDE
jgi:hypothetical protein